MLKFQMPTYPLLRLWHSFRRRVASGVLSGLRGKYNRSPPSGLTGMAPRHFAVVVFACCKSQYRALKREHEQQPQFKTAKILNAGKVRFWHGGTAGNTRFRGSWECTHRCVFDELTHCALFSTIKPEVPQLKYRKPAAAGRKPLNFLMYFLHG